MKIITNEKEHINIINADQLMNIQMVKANPPDKTIVRFYYNDNSSSSININTNDVDNVIELICGKFETVDLRVFQKWQH